MIKLIEEIMQPFLNFLHFTELPLEIQNLIISFFNEKYVFNLSQVSKYFSENVMRLCLRSVYCSEVVMFNNRKLKSLNFITALELTGCRKITDVGLSPLTNLTYLDLSWNLKITDNALKNLTRLHTLRLQCGPKIGSSLGTLTQLRSLTLTGDSLGADLTLRVLTNLTHLDLNSNSRIAYESLQHLTNLTVLTLRGCDNPPDLSQLTNLKRKNILSWW